MQADELMRRMEKIHLSRDYSDPADGLDAGWRMSRPPTADYWGSPAQRAHAEAAIKRMTESRRILADRSL